MCLNLRRRKSATDILARLCYRDAMRAVQAALGSVLLLCFALTLHVVHHLANRADFQADFQVYQTAAALVLHGEAPHIYDEADNGSDPQLKFAHPGSTYTEAAQQLGIPRVRLYVYPPVLADLLVPLAAVRAEIAEPIWIALNLAMLGLTAWMLASLLAIPLPSAGGFALIIGVFFLPPIGMCLLWGQITLLLLLLWAVGLFAYARGEKELSALALALATAIKLTPLLVLAPLLIWRDWRWVRGYALALAGIFVAVCLVNHPALLHDYFAHVMPSMSRGIPNTENKSLVSFVQLFYVALHGVRVTPVATPTMPIPQAVVSAAKLLALLTTLVVIAMLVRAGATLATGGRVLVLALLALVSACVSPVSWRHAYVVEVLPLALLWAHALRHRPSRTELAVLTVCSLELGSFLFDLISEHAGHGLLTIEPLLAPLAGIVLTLFFLSGGRLRRFTIPELTPAEAAVQLV